MRRAFIVALGLATALVLAGCTLFYPNAGTPNSELIKPTGSSSVTPGDETSQGKLHHLRPRHLLRLQFLQLWRLPN